MSSTPASPEQTWIDLAEENRGTPRLELSYTVFQSVLEDIALSKGELASKVSIDRDEALGLIDRMIEEGRLRVDRSGERVVAAGGLSLEPSRHTLVMNGRRFGCWCALDAVGIPGGLDEDATVESECVDTGEPVHIQIRNGRITEQSLANLSISLVPASVATSVFDTL
jgi:hypothetical protein